MPEASGPVSGRTATVVAASGLNLREAPSQTATVLATLGYGVSVTVTGESVNGFYPVRVGTLSGYASADYLRFGDASAAMQTADSAQTSAPAVQATPVPQAATQPDEPAADTYRVVVSSENGLRLRTAPDTSSEVVYILPYGMVLEVLSEGDNGFLYVRWDNYTGYVSGQFVTPLGNQ